MNWLGETGCPGERFLGKSSRNLTILREVRAGSTGRHGKGLRRPRDREQLGWAGAN